MDPATVNLAIAALGAVGALAALAWGLLVARRAWRILDRPNSQVLGIVAGTNDIHGRGRAANPVHSPITGLPCLWWSLAVQERSGRNNQWKTISRTSEAATFSLRDDSGEILVVGHGARFVGASRQTHTGFGDPLFGVPGESSQMMWFGTASRRFGSARRVTRRVEEYIPNDVDVFVSGPVTMQPHTGTLYFAAEAGGDPLVISTVDETSFVRRKLISAAIFVLVGAAAAVAAGGLRLDGVDPVTGQGLWVFEFGLAAQGAVWAYLLAAIAGYAIRTHERFVSLRERAAGAWSLLDVQLQRRADLISTLADVVAAAARVERDTLRHIAALRTRAQALNPSLPDDAGVGEADDITSGLGADHRALLAVAEAYPALKTQTNFASLQEELAITETRLALARSYYNDAVTALDTARQRFPSTLVAGFVRLPSYRLLHD